jgi:hypothetical protein
MSENEKRSRTRIDRRRFLKDIAATGAMGAIAAVHPAAAEPLASEDKTATKSWRDRPDPIDESLIIDGGAYDVVVVGGGNAGLLCARAASMNGASVAVIENQAEKSYIRGVGSQCGMINSKYALSQGAPKIDESDFLREWARRNVIRHNPKRASYFVKNSGKVFDWLISFADKEWLARSCHIMSCPPRPDVLLEVSGWKFYFGAATFRGGMGGPASKTDGKPNSTPVGMSGSAGGASGAASGMQGGMPGGAGGGDRGGGMPGGAAGGASGAGGMSAGGGGGPSSTNEPWPTLLKIHQEKAMADGAKWFFQHHAEICDVDTSGAVTGVIAKRADGKYVRFKARKGVALCAGDFSGNREMIIDILDDVRHQAEARGNLNLVRAGGGGGGVTRDGSGIKLGIWAGGHIEIGPHSSINDGDPGAGVWYLQLNHNGERFHDEASGTTLSQPIGSVRVTLYDANWKKAVGMMPPRHMAPDTSTGGDLSQRLSHLDNLKPGPIVKSQGNRMGGMGGSGLPGVSGTTCCANTIEELLDYMDCYKGETREKALAEIKRYNELCKKGVDEDFGKALLILKVTTVKDPLLYATVGTYTGSGMFGLGAGMNATTGLDTDAEGRVLDSNFKPIKGLYAAGNNAGGRYITTYQSPIAGISIGMAVTEGYMLGEMLAGM